MRRQLPGRTYRPGAHALLAVALLTASGCAGRRAPELTPNARFSLAVHELIAVEGFTPEYFEALTQLEEMGPEVDAALVSIARNPELSTNARANALTLLAERNSPAALPALRRALLTEEIPRLRSAAVLGLQRLADTSTAAMNLIESAVTDPSRSVRLNALQALDIREVGVLRQLLETERDREVRQVARQLVALAEARAAPLAPDRRGALRTTGSETDPQIVFRPVQVDSIADFATGDLRVELPDGPDVPLAPAAEVVGGVVPAFFSPDRSKVVFEADREIRVVDLGTRETLSLGAGVAPRLIPFTNEFVFLREQEGGRMENPRGTTLRYWVYRADFAGGEPDLVGELTATATPERHAHYSPVRWMVVGETPEGFVLRGDGVGDFPLPTPIWRSDPGGEPSPGHPSAAAAR